MHDSTLIRILRTDRLRGVAAPAALLASLAVSAPAFADEYAESPVSGGYVDPPSDAVVQIGSGQDDVTKEVALPFEFPFFGRLQSKVSICTNGWLAFGTTTVATSTNTTLPSTIAPNGIVAALWDDLRTHTGTVKTFTTGTAPNRVFVAAWSGVDTFSGASDAVLSFQVQLRESGGLIDVAYAENGVWDGLSYTAGIESPDGFTAFGGPNLLDSNSGQPSTGRRFTPSAVVVTGTLRRDRPVASAGGLGPSQENGLAVVGADVVIVREDTGEAAARGRTTADGTYSVTVLGIESPDTLAAELHASGEEGRVVDGTSSVYRHRFATAVPATGAQALASFTLGASVDGVNATIRRAVNIQQAAGRGFAFARDAAAFAVLGSDPPVAAETFPRIDFRWAPGVGGPSGRSAYTAATQTAAAFISIHDLADNPDPWDDDAVLRECGHHALATISVATPLAATRSFTVPSASPQAWSEGFATWFACAVQGRATFIDTKSATTADVLHLENATPTPQRRPDVTGAVACSLWELIDAANETIDEFEGTTGPPPSTAAEVLRTVDRDLDTTLPGKTTIDAGDFIARWRVAGPAPERAAAVRAFIGNGGLADDGREPNDRFVEASFAAAGVRRIDGLTLNQANEDVLRFPSVASGGQPLSALVVQTVPLGGAAAVIDVEILNSAGSVVASGTNAGSADPARLVVATAESVQSGDHAVRIVHRSGAASIYSVGLYEPLRLANPLLPDWTAGEPFKQDFIAVGGVPPYAFTITQSVPGLAKSLSDTRISGVPESGDYVVKIRVADGSGSASPFLLDAPFHVNGPLRLAPYVGADTNGPIDVPAGNGGTAAIWTITQSTSLPYITEGGPSLRVTGPASGPLSFTVDGTATDAVGASVGEAGNARVVVCDDMPIAERYEIPAIGHFGFGFDGVAGSRASFTFRFDGTGAAPELVAIVDAAGNPSDITLDGVVKRSGYRLRVNGAPLSTTNRWYAIFSRAGEFTGTVTANGGTRVPRVLQGLRVVPSAQGFVDVPVAVVSGARVSIMLRSEQTPTPVKPDFVAFLDPDGRAYEGVPNARTTHNGRRVDVPSFAVRPGGVYRLRFGGDRTGPVSYRVVVAQN